MYESHFQFQERPFVAAPQTGHYVATGAVEQARQTLVRCVERAEGPGLIVGPAGTGKSLLCQLLGEHFRGKQFQVALLSSARLSTRRALLQNILFELGLPYRGMEEGELRLSLIDHLEPRGSGVAGLLLVVDEAHTLPLRLLEEIRLISNFIRDGQPRVRLVLAGSAQLEERLASPKLESLQQRIAARCYLQPLSREETALYVRQQVKRAGGNPDKLFTSEALKAISTATDGVPRLINQVCDHVLLLAAHGGHSQISAEAVQEAWADLQQLPAPWQQTAASAANQGAAVEFGQLAEDGATPGSPSERSAPAPSGTPAELRATVNLDRIDRGLSALDSADEIEFGSLSGDLNDAREFEPVDASATEVELIFTTPANPFGDNFDEEEIVVDRYATLAAEAPQRVSFTAESHPWSKSGWELDETVEPAAELYFETAHEKAPASGKSSEPLRAPAAAAEEFNPASDPVLPEEPSHSGSRRQSAVARREEIVALPEDVGSRGKKLPGLARPKRREYRTLFSTLRSR